MTLLLLRYPSFFKDDAILSSLNNGMVITMALIIIHLRTELIYELCFYTFKSIKWFLMDAITIGNDGTH